MAIKTTQKTVSNSVGTYEYAPDATCFRVTIRNMDSANSIFLSGVNPATTTGFEIKFGESISLFTRDPFWLIAASAPVVTNILEENTD